MFKLKDRDGQVAFLMRTGKDLVKSEMTLSSAQNILANGKETETVNPDYPIAVDDKYFFEGEPVIEPKKGRK